MNVIFVTQSGFALFYLDLLPSLNRKLSFDRIGFYVTNKSHYSEYSEKAESLDLNVKFLKAWEMVSVIHKKPDYDVLRTLEREFGEPFLWDALVMDRVVYNGTLTTCMQDYKPRFTHDEMLTRLQESFKAVLEFIGDIKPDIIVGGFTPVSLGEYIFYLCAKAKGIKYINLNPTKILNYVTFSEEVCREFPHVEQDYKKYLEGDNKKDGFLEKADEYIQSNTDKYEGVIISSPRFAYKRWCMSILKWPYVVAKYYLRRDYLDNQVKADHLAYFYRNIYNPLKNRIVQRFVPYYTVKELSQLEYVYYPLHVEPEIALSLFGKEYLNQIELIRNIAKSIPVTWKLVVKDHPAGVGRRNIRYYKKLLEIPNVVLVNHYIDSKDVIKNAKMIFTVSGFSGFEALLKRKPVITFGKVFYNILPKYMANNVRSLQDLPFVVKWLLENYKYSEKNILYLIAAVIKNSVSLNLYTQVLKKEKRFAVSSEALSEQKKEFVDLLVQSISREAKIQLFEIKDKDLNLEYLSSVKSVG